jgi:hypothetical protein
MRSLYGTLKWMAGLGALAGVAMWPGAARAQMALAPGVSAQAGDQHVRSGIGISLQAGGGVSDFTGSTSRATPRPAATGTCGRCSGPGTSWAESWPTWVPSGALSNDAGLGSDASLVSHGGEGNLRLQLPFASSDGLLVEPFAFAGLGWSRYNFRNLSAGVVSNSDTVGTIPLGAGLTVGYRGFMVDARFTYRPTYDNDAFFGTTLSSGNLDTWNVGLMLGAEF